MAQTADFEDGRRVVELEVGDAEDLPVDDAAFDVVLSSFGAIFAPRHEAVATELTRACRPGGTIAFTAWVPGSHNDAVFSAIADQLPEPPAFQRPTLTVAFASVDDFESFILTKSGPIIAARHALEELGRWRDALTTMRAAMAATNEADDGGYRATWAYLLAIGTKSPRGR